LSGLSEHHEVVLVAAYWSEDERRDLEALPFRAVGVPLRRGPAVLRAGVALFRRLPLQQAYLDAKKMRRTIAAVEAEIEPDVVYFNTLRSAQWREATATPSRIIDLDEFRSAYYEQLSREASGLIWRRVARLEARRMRTEESHVVAAFDRVLVSSPADLRRDNSRVSLVRSPDALGATADVQPQDDVADLVFVGRMSYGANVDAITWFVQRVMPLVWERQPQVTLDVVGDAPAAPVRALACRRVRVLGRVESVAPYYLGARLNVVPVARATGVQMKLIEALRIGTPTIATPLVAQLAGVEDGVQVITAASPRDWSLAVLDLLADKRRATDLARRGQVWAERHHGSAATVRALLDCLPQPALPNR
jgi:glycosyltransferase involved in cell wall biosynthesis